MTDTAMPNSPEGFREAFSLALQGADAHRAGQLGEELARVVSCRLEPGRTPGAEWLGLLYAAGARDLLLSIFENYWDGREDLLPIMATAIYFERGERERALAAIKKISDLEARLLRLRTLEMMDALNAPLEKEPRVHLLILSHNRAGYVAGALRQLAATGYSNYAVYIADNGSTDGAWETVRKAAEFFPGQVEVSVERLPTNVGRPAGHNWLLEKYDHSAAEYIAIGDDDLISVPPDWLRKMVNTARAFPRCACVGARAVNREWPHLIHGAAFHITEFTDDTIRLSNHHEMDDYGQFDVLDMADHVNGCLHIYERKALEAAGHFDIRFSPAQFVDVEHHLRLRMAGYDVIFNGLIRVEHLRGMVNRSRERVGNSLGNAYKLIHKYLPEEVRRELTRRGEERIAWLSGESGL